MQTNVIASRAKRRMVGFGAALVAGAMGLAIPFEVAAVDIAGGSRTYQMRCVGCHGMDGKAINPDAPNFVAGDRLSQPDVALMMSVKTGKTRCPPFMGILSDQQLLDTLAYIRTLRR